MAFYLRKSFRAGPLRLNLSKSGLGVSAGVKEARIGLGPRGAYVHAGRGGLYFREQFKVRGAPQTVAQKHTLDLDMPSATAMPPPGSHADDLTRILSERAKKSRLLPWFVLVCIALVSALALLGRIETLYFAFPAAALIGTVIGTPYFARWDRSCTWTVLDIDLDPAAREVVQRALRDLQSLSRCQQLWEVAGLAEISDSRRRGGATKGLIRRPVTFRVRCPRRVESGVPVFSLQTSKGALYFLLDRILIYNRHICSVPYERLQIRCGVGPLLEFGRPPSDSRVIGSRWQYSNNDGSPDRRFSSNRELPIMEYGEIVMQSDSGLRLAIQTSDPTAPERFRSAIEGLMTLSQPQARDVN